MPPTVDRFSRSENELLDSGPRARLTERLQFLWEFARNPKNTGAIAPSSTALARAMVAGMDLKHSRHVVELGAGTGAFTSLIARRVPQAASFMAMELNPRMAEKLRQTFGDEVDVVCASAADLCRHLGRARVGQVDAVISSLPWVCFPADEQHAILQEIYRALRPGGKFTTFAYTHAAWLPSGVKFRRELRRVFTHCEVRPIVWRNLPPAFVYRGEKPGGGRRGR